MPFKSKAQMRFMYAKHPEIAKRWEDTYGISKDMPNKVNGGNIEARIKRATAPKKKKKK
jgi:hypothetical protein